tara:strand:+ start:107 stop:388 length:282 start_codon:yes stop_codon:yes gene_type:complete
MAVGDVVNGVSSGSAVIYFQPSGSTEYVITSFHLGDYDGRAYIGTSGVKAHIKYEPNYEASGGVGNTKVMINNTNYLGVKGYPKSGYTGIQIK